jgi:hypothetical protein
MKAFRVLMSKLTIGGLGTWMLDPEEEGEGYFGKSARASL